MKNMVYLQSGGPTSVINSSLYGVIKESKKQFKNNEILFGSLNGIEGLIDNKLINLFSEEENEIELLKQTPGCILGTSRKKLPSDLSDPIYEKIISTLKAHDIGYVLVNGGNDSMDTCNKLSCISKEYDLELKVIGIPKTVDNDLAGTDHSLGFASAAKFVINTVHSLTLDVQGYIKGIVTIMEIMGRNAGWLTASADILPEGNRPDLFYIPEVNFDIDKFINDVKRVYDKKGRVLAVVSEGINVDREHNKHVDNFGHCKLEGVCDYLCSEVEERLGIRSRLISLSLSQRVNSLSISKTEQTEAIEVGEFAVQSVLNNENSKMVIIERVNSSPYKVKYSLKNVNEIANLEKKIPEDMIKDETGFTNKFKEYIKPLIVGEIDTRYENGVALASKLKKEIVK